MIVCYVFRYEYAEQQVVLNDQVQIGVKNTITIRTNRFTSNACISSGGQQNVKVFRQSELFNEPLVNNYHLDECT